MKKILFVCILINFTTLYVSAQNVRNTEPPKTLFTNAAGKFVLDSVVEIKDASKEDLYKHMKSWVLKNVPASGEGVSLFNPNEMLINTDIVVPSGRIPGARVNFKLTAQFKDGRTKVSFSGFQYTYIGQGKFYESPLEDIKGLGMYGKGRLYKLFDDDFEGFLNDFFKSFETYQKDSDW